MKKLIVFDMDGTLIDSAADIGAAIAHAATKVCNLPDELITVEQTRPLTGKSLHTIFTTLLPVEHHSRIEECITAYRTHYIAGCATQTQVYPGLLEILTDLKQQGIKLAVATAKAQTTIDVVAAKLDLTPYFDLIQGIDGFPSKPDPHILRLVMSKLGVGPAETLMIGDTDNDVLCAQAAGVTACAVTWGSWTLSQLLTLEPAYLVTNAAELRAVLEPELEGARI